MPPRRNHSEELGRQLRKVRQLRGRDQQAVADEIGIHGSTLSRIEKGTTLNDALSVFTRLARALNVEICISSERTRVLDEIAG